MLEARCACHDHVHVHVQRRWMLEARCACNGAAWFVQRPRSLLLTSASCTHEPAPLHMYTV